MLGDDFKRRVIDLNGKPRALINIYINGKNIRFNNTGMNSVLNDGDSVYILPAVAGGAEITSEDMIRYSRQIMLEEIGYVGMEKLKNVKICVVGAGGIGNPVVTQLVGMGVGKIKLVIEMWWKFLTCIDSICMLKQMLVKLKLKPLKNVYKK